MNAILTRINQNHFQNIPTTFFKLIIILLTVATIFFYVIFPSEANGKTGKLLEFKQGPYNIELRSYPTEIRQGNMHFSMVINHIENGSPVENLSINVILFGPPPENIFIGQTKLVKDRVYPNWYDFSANLNQSGKWNLDGQIIENEQITDFSIQLDVYPEDFNWGIIIVFFSSLPVLVSIAWYMRTLKSKYKKT